MITFENISVTGFAAALRGMRNPLNSWKKSDSTITYENGEEVAHIGPNDLDLMKRLRKAGSDHRKYLRMINVTMDITAMQPWWFEFDTYKVGTVRNSCSKMHKIHSKTFTAADFAHDGIDQIPYAQEALNAVVAACEQLRQMNYEVLLHMYWSRKDHKLTEWHEFCRMIEGLPYFREVCLLEEEG